MDKVKKNKFSYPIIISDILAYAVVGFTSLVAVLMLLVHMKMPNNSVFNGLGIGASLVLLLTFSAHIYIDYRYNRIEIKNPFLYIGGIIFLINLIAVSIQQNVISLPNNASYNFLALERAFNILGVSAFALLPYTFFYLLPHRILSNHYLKILLIVLIGFVVIATLASFVMDREIIASAFRGKLDASGAKSFLGNKNDFGRFLVASIVGATILHKITKNWKWLLLIILFYPFLMITFSKVNMLLGSVYLLIYLFIHLYYLAKKSRDNLVITSLVSGFVVLLVTFLSIMIAKSTGGPLLTIKNIFSDFAINAKNTYESRKIIWDCGFKMLSPFQFAIGFGYGIFGQALNLVYVNDLRFPSWEARDIFSAHNGVVELIGRGGILTLLICLFFYAYLIYISIKVYKKNKSFLSIITIICLILYMLQSVFWSACLFSEQSISNIFVNAILVLPVMSQYFMYVDKKEIAWRKHIISSANEIKKTNYKSLFANLNKKRLVYEAQYIDKD